METKKVIAWLITVGAILDTLTGVIMDNQGLLIELGIPTVVTKVIMLLGLLFNSFNKSLTSKSIGGSNPPPKKDEK